MARGRRNYEQVSHTVATEGTPEEQTAPLQEVSLTEAPLGNTNHRRSRRQYSRISLDDEEQANEETPTESNNESATLNPSPVALPDDGRRITVTVLDYTQKKWRITVRPSATVQTLKLEGAKIHKVAADRQRLIYLGKQLADDGILEDCGINEDDLIIHLFPKPRVVIKDESPSVATNDTTEEEDDGARVPTIVLDAAEAERRSQILVLGSADYIEAQNNVKLFSFMLLIISSIELLNLTAIALGVPQQDGSGEFGPLSEDDDIFGPTDDSRNHNGTSYSDGSNIEYMEWGLPNWFDLVVSTLGVYVALTGLKASNLNTLRLAKQYLYGTVVVGIGWLLFNYFMTYEIDKQVEEDREENQTDDLVPPLSSRDIAYQALSVMVLPGMIWFMCCVRAWQFHYLLQEAEQEAEERIQSELDSTRGDEELALQDESVTVT